MISSLFVVLLLLCFVVFYFKMHPNTSMNVLLSVYLDMNLNKKYKCLGVSSRTFVDTIRVCI